MITETATVSQLGIDWVEVTSEIKSTCSGCQQVDTCGSGQVSKAFPQKRLSLQVSTAHFKELLKLGDKVEIAIPQDKLLHSLWHVYGIPVIFLIVFAGIGQQVITPHSHELLSVAFSILGGWLGYRLAKTLENSQSKQDKLMPYLVRKLSNSTSPVQVIDVI